jgi:thiosulfate/3-mercaptopyruvate sulfurtransferase
MTFGPLISAEALAGAGSSVRLLDARPGPEGYAAGRLARAVHADLEADLSAATAPGFDPARGGRHPLPPLPAWARRLGAWGIGPSTRVVVYDGAGGGNAAARAWWMLKAVGHAEVAVLDGGLQAAQAAGLAQERGSPPDLQALPPYPCDAWRRPLADLEAVARRVQDPAWKVLDVRSRERWRGEVEPFDPVKGRIPGTLNLPFAENLEPTGRFKAPADLRALYLGLLGGTPPGRLVVHCGSGVTACQTLLALEVAGLDGASLYVGSFGEWCRSGRPVYPHIP